MKMFSKAYGIAGIWQTMYFMKDVILTDLRDHSLKDFVVDLIIDINPMDDKKIIDRIYKYLKSKIKYVKDINRFEEIKSPHSMIYEIKKRGYTYGDCDDMSMLSAFFYKIVGYPVRFVVISTNGKQYNHIRTELRLGNTWIPIDLASQRGDYKPIPSVGLKELVLDI